MRSLTALLLLTIAPTSARPVLVPLEPYAGSLRQVSVVANGKPLKLLLDTGGGVTLLTPAAAATVGCRVFGRATGFRMTGERVDVRRCADITLGIGGRMLAGTEVGVWDLSSVLPAGLPPIDGVLALGSFAGSAITLELARNRLTIETAASLKRRAAGMRPIRMRVATGEGGGQLTVYVAARAPAGPLWLLLDSGNLAGVLMAPHALEQLGASVSQESERDLDVIGMGPIRTRLIPKDLIHDGALGYEFMRRAVWTLDLASGRGWVRPSPATAAAQPPDRRAWPRLAGT